MIEKFINTYYFVGSNFIANKNKFEVLKLTPSRSIWLPKCLCTSGNVFEITNVQNKILYYQLQQDRTFIEVNKSDKESIYLENFCGFIVDGTICNIINKVYISSIIFDEKLCVNLNIRQNNIMLEPEVNNKMYDFESYIRNLQVLSKIIKPLETTIKVYISPTIQMEARNYEMV